MTLIERQTRRVQHRLWLNRWFMALAWCGTGAAGAFALLVLVQRAFSFGFSVFVPGLVLAAGAVIASLVYLVLTRESAAVAAVRLDEAAGLRERISSGRYYEVSDDPFAQAVRADAENVAASVTVRQHVRLRTPDGLAWTGGASLLAALMFLVPLGVFASEQAVQQNRQVAEMRQTATVLKRNLDPVVEMFQSNPALKDLEDEAKKLKEEPSSKLTRPMDLERETVKKLDNLADAVKQKRAESRFDDAQSMRKALRGLKVPTESDAATQKLSKALAQGDFQAAREEIKALQEQLATLEHEEDKEMVEKLGKQLKELSEQLDELAQNKELQQKLSQAGVDPEQVDRLLNNLKKEDLEQVKKQLQEQGLSQQQIQQLAEQLQQQQSRCSQCKQLSKSMGQAGQCGQGQMGEAMSGLSMADQQLSELEQLEQEMNQLDAAMSQLQDAKNGCQGGKCNGQQGKGQGQGGMGKLGRGKGGLAPEAQTDVDFKKERAKVHTGKGSIIGQFLIEGEQVKGEVSKEFVEVVKAAEREASDAVSRDRVPRQYQKAVKEYFSNVQRAVGGKPAPRDPATEASETDGTESEAESSSKSAPEEPGATPAENGGTDD